MRGLFDGAKQEGECIHVRAVGRWRADGSYAVECMCGETWPDYETWEEWTKGGKLVAADRPRRHRENEREAYRELKQEEYYRKRFGQLGRGRATTGGSTDG